MKLQIHQHRHGRACPFLRPVLRFTQLLTGLRRAGDCAPCLVAALLFATLAASAQTAGAFFDGGAQLYISNNIPAALEKTEKGLKLYPDDPKLKKLEELLKQQQQSQSQSQQNQQNQQNQQSQSQQNKSQQNQSQQDQSQQQRQNQNSQAQNQQNQQRQNQQNQIQANQNKQQPAQQAQQKTGGQNGGHANAMTPEDARRLLDAQKDNEQFLQMGPKGNPQTENQPVKDW